MRLKFKLILATALLAVYPAFSQDAPFSSMSLGVKASTLGYGFEAATSLHKLLVLRLGITTTAGINLGEYKIPIPDNLDGDVNASFGYIPEFSAKPGLKFSHGNLLVDFYPAGIFHLTAGAFMGKSSLLLSGQVVDKTGQPAVLLPGKNWPVIEFGDQKVDLTGGRTDIDLRLGKSGFKPYLGLGFGRTIPKNKVSFKFELGVLLQNGYTIKNDGISLDFSTSTQKELVDAHDFLTSYIKVWPLLNFQLSYRIF